VFAVGHGFDEVVAVPAPVLRLRRRRLHCETGPAVAWQSGSALYFWHGVEVPEAVVLDPENLGAQRILEEPNVEVRRVMLERFGCDRFVKDLGLKAKQQDEFGTLYRMAIRDDELGVRVSGA